MKRNITTILTIAAAGLMFASCCNRANSTSEEPVSKEVHAALDAYRFELDTTIKTPAFDPYELGEEPVFDMVTTAGTIRFKFYRQTPLHRAVYTKLIAGHFFDGILFHRVVDGFMIQGGDPYTKDTSKVALYGQGGPDYTIPAEFVSEYWHKKGAIAAARKGDMANPKKASSGSQFYIVQDENNCLHLDGQYSIFGETIEGLDVIDRIAKVPTDRYDRPLQDVRIITIKPVEPEIPEEAAPADSTSTAPQE